MKSKCVVARFNVACIYAIHGLFRNEPPHDKTNKMTVRPAKTQIRLADAQSDQSLRCALNE